MLDGCELLGDPAKTSGGLSESQIDLRVLDALGQAGLTRVTLAGVVELEGNDLDAALQRLEAAARASGTAKSHPSTGESTRVWVATSAGRDHLAGAFRQPLVDERIRWALLVGVDILDPTTAEMTCRMRWHLPALGLRRLRDVHSGWARRSLADLAEQGLVKAVPDQQSDEVIWVALPPVEQEFARLEALHG